MQNEQQVQPMRNEPMNAPNMDSITSKRSQCSTSNYNRTCYA
jgi:hypothetical protein